MARNQSPPSSVNPIIDQQREWIAIEAGRYDFGSVRRLQRGEPVMSHQQAIAIIGESGPELIQNNKGNTLSVVNLLRSSGYRLKGEKRLDEYMKRITGTKYTDPIDTKTYVSCGHELAVEMFKLLENRCCLCDIPALLIPFPPPTPSHIQ